jgi:hypothetical protein
VRYVALVLIVAIMVWLYIREASGSRLTGADQGRR